VETSLLCRKHGVSARSPKSAYLGISIALACGSAHAANWELAPRVEAGYRYSDNYRLDLPGGEIDVSGAEADAALTIRTLDPRTRFEVTPRIRATYFPDEPDEESTDYYLGALLSDTTPRRSVGIGLDLAHEDVIRSELPDADVGGDLGNPGPVDSGRVIERNTRDLIQANPYFTYDLTQRYGMELRARYIDANYDKDNIGSQEDFSDAGVSAGMIFRYSERNNLTLRATASKYETSFDTEAYGGEVQWDTKFSPTSRMYVRLGGQQTEPENRPSETNFTGGVGGRWDSPRNALFLDLTSTVSPVSAGTVVQRHQLRMRIDHDVSPRLALQFGGRLSHDEELGDGGTYPTRDYATVDAGFEWRVLRFLAVTATYSYRWQEYEDEPSDRSANSFLIGLVYEPKRPD
jgi:hypothetical protein